VCIEQYDFYARAWIRLDHIPPQSVYEPATIANAGNLPSAVAPIPFKD
jgi:hypothetical protein